MLEKLKNDFYAVMRKYDLPFSETGVLANLHQWEREKSPLRNLLCRHPEWRDEELAIVFAISENRGTDTDIVDEAGFELLELADVVLNDKEAFSNFRKALNAATADYAQIPEVHRLDTIRQFGGIKCDKGQKASRIINRLCVKFGIDRYETERTSGTEEGAQTRIVKPYNSIFARLADALNPVMIQKTAILSIHPCDFLEMSNKDNSWSSCHSLDHGSYKGGCQSYMGDAVSMIFFTVDNDVTKDFHKAPRLEREVFCYADGILLRSRLYPTDNYDQKTIYRHAIQKAMALCLNVPNLWSISRTLNDIRTYTHTQHSSNHYPDYLHDYASLSLLNGRETYGCLTIGSIARCTCCGNEQTNSTRIHCGCPPTVVCKECNQTVPRSQATYMDGAHYCNQCVRICAACRSLVHGTVYPAYDRRGNLTQVCESCHALILAPCNYCNIRNICAMIQSERFCPHISVRGAA